MELGQKEITTGEKIYKFYYPQKIRETPSGLWQHKMAI
jgi:hypothetical protein